MNRKNLITILRQYKLNNLTEDEAVNLIEGLYNYYTISTIPITTPYYKWEATY